MANQKKAGVARLKTGMPSTGHLERSLRGKRDLGKLIGVHSLPSGRGKQIADGYVRLVEKARLEYEDSRSKLIDFLAEGMADDAYRAEDYFESSVQSLHRAIEYLVRLRSLGYQRSDDSPFIPKPRNLEVLRENVRTQVRKMRDAGEHLDNDILSQKIAENAKAGIHLGWESASLGDEELRYTDIARWLEQLHEIAVVLSRVQLTVGPTEVDDAESA